MEKIRVLVVDDSLVIRRALRECFRADPEIEVVGVAEDGVKALKQIDLLKPDIVTLDIEMPEMDGLEALKVIRAKGSTIPIIMFSKYTSEGATATLEALELGASDVVAKPEAHGGKGSSCEVVKRQLTSLIRALGRSARRIRHARTQPGQHQTKDPETGKFSVPRPIDAVALAISTGGPSALIEVVSGLQPDLPLPIFITQHMPPMFTKFLAERLTARGALKAFEAEDGMLVEPGRIYIAPGNFHLEAAREDSQIQLRLSQAPHENSCRPSADVMFRSLATVYGSRLLGIVMTGMGQDGKRGAETIKSHGGIIVAQDEASSLVWGMPRAIISAELHDGIVSLAEVSRLINESASKGRKENK